MFKSLKSKLTFPIVGILIIVMGAVIVTSAISVNSLATELIFERVEAVSSAVESHIAQLEVQTNVVAMSVAADYTLLSAIRAWNEGINRPANRQIIINTINALHSTIVTTGGLRYVSTPSISIRANV